MSLPEAAIGWLAPPQCIKCGAEGSALCLNCSETCLTPYGQRCLGCNILSPNSKTCSGCRHLRLPSHVWIATVYETTAQELVKLYKFGQQRIAAKSIARLMSNNFVLNDRLAPPSDYLVVPVPTATSRVRQRGFDHTVLLARTISNDLGLEYCRGLGRLGQSRQVGLERRERLSQSIGSYFVRSPMLIRGRKILLVDDVATTGATLKAATSVLKASGAAQVDALIFAKGL